MATSAKAKAIGQRGKFAEKVVNTLFTHLNATYHHFAFEKMADARAAGGRLKSQICDFLAWYQLPEDGGGVLKFSYQVEVKQTSHNFRLAKDKLKQLARLRKVRYAGGTGLVLVYHTSTEMWRAIPLEFFDGEIPPSWDLSGVPQYDSIEEALNNCSVVFPNIPR